MRFDVRAIPVLPGTREALRLGVRTGGAERNEEYLRELVSWGDTSDEDRAILIDPQTSGGLLVAVSSDRIGEYLSLVSGAVVVGEVVEGGDCGVILT